MSRANMSLYHIDDRALVMTVLRSFGDSFITPQMIDQGMRAVARASRPEPGIAKVVFDNVNRLLTQNNLPNVGFSTLTPVIYNMIHMNATKNKHTAHRRYKLFQQLLTDRFKTKTPTPVKAVEPKAETKAEPKAEPKAGIMKVATVDRRVLVQDLIAIGFQLPEAIEMVKQMD